MPRELDILSRRMQNHRSAMLQLNSKPSLEDSRYIQSRSQVDFHTEGSQSGLRSSSLNIRRKSSRLTPGQVIRARETDANSDKTPALIIKSLRGIAITTPTRIPPKNALTWRKLAPHLIPAPPPKPQERPKEKRNFEAFLQSLRAQSFHRFRHTLGP